MLHILHGAQRLLAVPLHCPALAATRATFLCSAATLVALYCPLSLQELAAVLADTAAHEAAAVAEAVAAERLNCIYRFAGVSCKRVCMLATGLVFSGLECTSATASDPPACLPACRRAYPPSCSFCRTITLREICWQAMALLPLPAACRLQSPPSLSLQPPATSTWISTSWPSHPPMHGAMLHPPSSPQLWV